MFCVIQNFGQADIFKNGRLISILILINSYLIIAASLLLT